MRGLIAAMVIVTVLALLPYTQDPARDSKYIVLHIGVAAAALAGLLGVALGGIRLRRPSLTGCLLLGYLGINLVAALASAHVLNSLNAWRHYAVLALLFFLAAAAFRKPEHATRLLTAACAAIALSSVYGLCQKLGLDPFPWADRSLEEYRNLPATYGNPNIAAHSLNLGLIIALGLVCAQWRSSTNTGHAKWKETAIPAAMALLIAAHIYFTQARAAVVALAAALFLALAAVTVARVGRGAPGRKVVAVLVTLALAGMAAAGLAAGISKARSGSWLPLDRSLLLRYHGYYGAARMVAEQPILGFGPGNYHIDNPPYWTSFERDRFAIKPMVNTNVHNEYLEAAVEGGLLSAALYIGFLITAIACSLWMFFSARDGGTRILALTLAACFCAFAVDGLFGFNFRVPVSAMLLLVLAGVLAGMVDTPAFGRKAALGLPAVATVAALLLLVLDVRGFMASHYLLRAQGAAVYKDMAAAKSALLKGQRLAPWNFQFPRELGLLHMAREIKDANAAIAYFEQAARLHPNEVRQYMMLGLAHINCVTAAAHDAAGRDAARAHLQAAGEAAAKGLALCPKLPQLHELLGRLAIIRGRGMVEGTPPPPEERRKAYEEAAAHFRDALGYATDKPGPASLMLAEADIALDKLDDAEKMLVHAAHVDAKNPEVWRVFEDYATKAKRWPAFIAQASAALKEEKTQPQPDAARISLYTGALGRAYAAAGKPEQARAVLEEAIAGDPARADLWAAYAGALPAAERRERLVELYRRLRPEIPEETAAELSVLGALSESGGATGAAGALREGAMAYLQKAGPPGLAGQYRWLADLVTEELNHTAVSVTGENGDLGEAYHSAGFVYLMMDAWPEANALLARALEYLPAGQQVYCQLHQSEALAKMEKYEQALAVAQEARSQAPSLVQTNYQYIKMLALAGYKEEARQEYEMLVASPGVEAAAKKQIQTELEPLLKK